MVNYNGERYLEESLGSVFTQKEKFEEILLIDNTSQDRGLEIVRNRFLTVKVIQLSKNLGPRAARNVGFKASSCNLYKLKRALPWQLIREVATRLPQEIQNRLVEIWSAGMFDWSITRYFPLPMDHAGYLRINVKGREPEGIVEPGNEYDAIL